MYNLTSLSSLPSMFEYLLKFRSFKTLAACLFDSALPWNSFPNNLVNSHTKLLSSSRQRLLPTHFLTETTPDADSSFSG